MSDFTLEDLVNMQLDNHEERLSLDKPKKPKKYESSSDSEDASERMAYKKKKKKKKSSCMVSNKTKEVLIIFVLFVVLSSKLVSGQADKLMRIQAENYSIYDLLVRGIAMTLLFFIFCRLFQ